MRFVGGVSRKPQCSALVEFFIDFPVKSGDHSGMFIRTKTTPYGKTRVQIVQSIRSGSQVTQRVVRHVGTADSDEQLRQLRVLGRTIIEELNQAASPQQSLLTPKQHAELYEHSRAALLASRQARKPVSFGVDVSDCREIARVGAGVREAMSELIRQLGWDQLLGARRHSANQILRELILGRLSQPLSKRATVRDLKEHDEVPLNLDYVYRTMDQLDDGLIGKIKKQSLESAQTLYDEPISVVFYDTTTLAFASEREDEDPQEEKSTDKSADKQAAKPATEADPGIRYKGYSKDGKPHRVQVMLALLVNPDGIPMGYELFPGNTVEITTLITAIEQLQQNHPGVRFTLVADAGLISANNEALLQARNIPSLLGARLKAQKAPVREWILEEDGFLPWEGQDKPGKPNKSGKPKRVERYKVRTMDQDKNQHKGKDPEKDNNKARLIVTHCDRRARKDARLRDRQIARLKRRLEHNGSPASLSQRGSARFLSFPDGQVQLNEAKINEATRWDGLHGLQAWGLDDSDPRALIRQYRRRWEIEACFRTNKHDLKIRPIFHWKPRRIRGHIAICYMAFCCLQHLRHRLAIRGTPMSPAAIRRALNSLQFSLLEHNKTRQQFAMPSKTTAEASRIYRCLGLKWNESPFPVPVKERTSRKTSNPKSRPPT